MSITSETQESAPYIWLKVAQALFKKPPSGLDAATRDLLGRIATVRDALDLALADDGAAVTSGEARARGDVLASLAGQLEDLLCSLVAGLPGEIQASPPSSSVPLHAR